jgi:hypothetical protein
VQRGVGCGRLHVSAIVGLPPSFFETHFETAERARAEATQSSPDALRFE